MLLGSGLLAVMKLLTTEGRVLFLVTQHVMTDVILTRGTRCWVFFLQVVGILKCETESEHTTMSPVSTSTTLK